MTEPETPPRWRPVARIRPIAVGVVLRDAHLLAMRVYDDAGALKGVRSPGGGVDFGERAADALRREFREEFDCDLTVAEPPVVLENLYVHEGAPGHEIVFAFRARLGPDAPSALGALDGVFGVDEGGGVHCEVAWIPLADIRSGAVRLFPDGLADRLSDLPAAP